MACPCCPTNCCPAFRAFDGSDNFYRYLIAYDWDIPTAGSTFYILQPQDNDIARCGETPCPPNRPVDGHVVFDAAERCVSAVQAGDPGQPFWPPGNYGRLRGDLKFDQNGNISAGVLLQRVGGGGVAATGPAPLRPWRLESVLKIGAGFYNDGSGLDKWTPATGDPSEREYIVNQIPFLQHQGGNTLMRAELRGKYPSRPSPYCYLNNPLP